MRGIFRRKRALIRCLGKGVVGAMKPEELGRGLKLAFELDQAKRRHDQSKVDTIVGRLARLVIEVNEGK